MCRSLVDRFAGAVLAVVALVVLTTGTIDKFCWFFFVESMIEGPDLVAMARDASTRRGGVAEEVDAEVEEEEEDNGEDVDEGPEPPVGVDTPR